MIIFILTTFLSLSDAIYNQCNDGDEILIQENSGKIQVFNPGNKLHCTWILGPLAKGLGKSSF